MLHIICLTYTIRSAAITSRSMIFVSISCCLLLDYRFFFSFSCSFIRSLGRLNPFIHIRWFYFSCLFARNESRSWFAWASACRIFFLLRFFFCTHTFFVHIELCYKLIRLTPFDCMHINCNERFLSFCARVPDLRYVYSVINMFFFLFAVMSSLSLLSLLLLLLIVWYLCFPFVCSVLILSDK